MDRRLLFLVLIGGSTIAAEPNGIAAKYPGDRGLEKDPAVIFVESFDSDSIACVAKRWESVKGEDLMSLVADAPAGAGDRKSLLLTHVGGKGDGGYLYRRLNPGYDKLHYRFYVKFADDCGPITHFVQAGGFNPATHWPQGGAGVRPRGNDRFSAAVEPFGDRRQWDFYNYWKAMRGSPPRGQTWGNSFLHNPELKVRRGEWICLEFMLKLNDPDKSNGEAALWIDGESVGRLGPGFPKGKWIYDKFLPGEGGESVRWNDETKRPETRTVPADGEPFEGFAWRSDAKLNLNYLWMLCFITKSPEGHVSKIGFDGIVVAKDYIGPIRAANR